ncbi:MAG: flagellar export protein FliJ [Oscillospiraceae bacterium]|mgnify:FL=1|jgi:flagellar FliJ protein|nr:flagellar export protein FliJ [Oscillospiraceae bacterium]MCI9393473.1 flagellar export protein FliJ [Oscillospiraceae bacterium]MCI9580084.1 flagellar export protein FliJ [Oscillospiraceae bacterium]
MKKFQFSLDTVLDYKQQVLTSLQSEHGAILLRVRQQEEVLEQTEHAHRELNEEFTRRRAEGISIKDALMLESGLRVLERDIDREAQKLLALQKQEEKKRDEVIEAKKETSSLEMLRDKKLEQYRKEEAKQDELFIEEIVTTARVMAAAGV